MYKYRYLLVLSFAILLVLLSNRRLRPKLTGVIGILRKYMIMIIIITIIILMIYIVLHMARGARPRSVSARAAPRAVWGCRAHSISKAPARKLLAYPDIIISISISISISVVFVSYYHYHHGYYCITIVIIMNFVVRAMYVVPGYVHMH